MVRCLLSSSPLIHPSERICLSTSGILSVTLQPTYLLHESLASRLEQPCPYDQVEEEHDVNLVITVSGLHGTGKTTIAEILAKRLGLRHISAGRLFRQIAEERGLSLGDLSEEASKKDDLDKLVDMRTREEAKKGNVVIDGLLVGWIVRKDANLKFHLFAPDGVRIARIARRDKCSFDEAEKATFFRERLERRRFKRFYVIDIDDYSIYDLVLNTALLSPNGNARVLEYLVRAYMKEQVVS